MPLAHIFIQEGRSEEQTDAAIEKVTDALAESLDSPREKIRVLIQEIPKGKWGVAGKSAMKIQQEKNSWNKKVIETVLCERFTQCCQNRKLTSIEYITRNVKCNDKTTKCEPQDKMRDKIYIAQIFRV